MASSPSNATARPISADSADIPVARPWTTTVPGCPGHPCIDTAVAYARAHAGDGAFWVVTGPDGAWTHGRNAPPCPMAMAALAQWCDP